MFGLDEEESPFGDTNICLEVDKFQKACSKLNVNANDRLLDVYEKYGLIFPVYRINRPKKYLQIIFEQKYGDWTDRPVISVPNKYGALLEFEYEKLHNWHAILSPEFDQALKGVHPLDHAHKEGERFIKIPSKRTYKEWKEYALKLELSLDGRPIKYTESTARHFYSPWQIYLLDEANQWYTSPINALLPFAENKTRILNNPLRKLSLADWSEHFKSLWLYRFRENLLFEKAMFGLKKNVLEGNDARMFFEQRKEIAKTVSEQHSYESWIAFLRILCERYFDYREREKYRLASQLKKDIKEAVSFLIYGLGKTYRDIIDDVGLTLGGRSYSYIPPLERIWPEYESLLRREAKLSLNTVLDYYNQNVPHDLKLDKIAVDNIIDHAFTTGNEALLVSLLGIHKEYYSPSYFGKEGIWSYIRSLAVAVESWVKEVTNKNDFYGGIIESATGDFKTCCEQLLQEAKNKSMYVHNFLELKQFIDELKTINFIIESKDVSWMKYLIRAYLVRNYAVHHTKLEPELFGETLIELYRSLLFLVFYSWVKKKN